MAQSACLVGHCLVVLPGFLFKNEKWCPTVRHKYITP